MPFIVHLCRKCGHDWSKRVGTTTPNTCPSCRTREWNSIKITDVNGLLVKLCTSCAQKFIATTPHVKTLTQPVKQLHATSQVNEI